MAKPLYIIIFLLQFSNIYSQHIIKGTLKNSSEPLTVYLQEFKNNHWLKLDSVTTHNNTFMFTTNSNSSLLSLTFKNNNLLNIEFLNTNGTSEVAIDLKKDTYVIKGSTKNEDYKKYQDFIKPYRTKLVELRDNKPTIENPSSFTIKERNAYHDHFQAQKTINEQIELVKFTFIEKNKKNSYTQELIEQKLNTTFNETHYELWERFYNNLPANHKNSERGEKLNKFLKTYEHLKIGSLIKNFTLPDQHKKQQSLYDNLGTYTIIYFWASWCAPCKKETPNNVALYKKYHIKGLQIIGISLDTDYNRWVNTIEKDQLNWIQLSNLTGWKEPLLDYFKVTAIPNTIILDKKGKIIAKNLKGEQLSQKLSDLLD